MSSETHMSSASRPRQKPGFACEECRRRKLRCDRQQPHCGPCEASGVICQVASSSTTRGPKRGYLKVLHARLAALEDSLLQQQQVQLQQQQQQQQTETITNASPDEVSIDGLAFDDQSTLLWDFPSISDEDTFLTDTHPASQAASSTAIGFPINEVSIGAFASPPRSSNGAHNGDVAVQDSVINAISFDPSNGPCEIKTSQLMQEDLDQLYLDRIHVFAPILHQRNYFGWRRDSNKTEAQKCLQFAMWTLAASVSVPYQGVASSFYQCARRLLDDIDSQNASQGVQDIESVQAWLLLAIHEFMCVSFGRAWSSAGRAFRLIQLNWLQDADNPDAPLKQADWVITEQKRRTFWLAYCLDRFFSARSDSPFTFSEQVSIRLPAPEMEFQNDQPTPMGFLWKALAAQDVGPTSAFVECVLVATLCGRALSHRHQFSMDKAFFNATENFWDWNQGTSAIVIRRMDLFSVNYQPALQEADPTILFISMMWRTTILCLYQTIDRVVPPTQRKEPAVVEFTRRASIAAQEMVKLTTSLLQGSHMKIHPLTSIPLSLCADFFTSCCDFGDPLTPQLRQVAKAMRGLKSFDSLAAAFRLHESA